MSHSIKRSLPKIFLTLMIVLAVGIVALGIKIAFDKTDGNINHNRLVINEISVKNLLGLKDKAGNYSDWIELYNGTDEDICIGGYGISDDEDRPFRYKIPSDTVIKSHSYFVIFSSLEPNGEEYNTGFALSEGERVVLTDSERNTLDYVDIPDIVDYGVSVGRCKNSSTQFAVLSTPTPGKFNNSSVITRIIPDSEAVKAPAFSAEGGFYKEEFMLELTSEDPSAVIYYTLDGSEPDKTSKVYKKPIKIRDRRNDENVYSDYMTSAYYYRFLLKPNDDKLYKGTTVRARCCVNGVFSKECITNTYFINPDYSLPIISLTTDPDNLFDEEKGIYVPGNDMKIWRKYNPEKQSVEAPLFLNFGDSEVPGHVEFYETDGEKVIDSDIGISINGMFSSADRCKSLYIRPSSKYGKSKFEYDIFEGKAKDADGSTIDTYKGFVLRNSGADFFYTMFRDAFFQAAAYDYYDTLQAYRPCILFIDGEYWGIHNIREKYCEEYFETHFGVDADTVDIIKYSDVFPETVAGKSESADEFVALGEYALNHDLNVQEYYDYIDERVDIENYIKYMSYYIYINNGDFLANNVRAWRSDDKNSKYGDSKWRFAVYDLDRALTQGNVNMVQRAFNEDKNLPQYAYIVLFRQLMKRDDCKKEFLKQIDILSSEVFTDEQIDEVIDEMKNNIQCEMEEHFSRWKFKRALIGTILNGFDSYLEDNSYQNWLDSIEEMRSAAKARHKEMYEWLDEYMP